MKGHIHINYKFKNKCNQRSETSTDSTKLQIFDENIEETN